MNMKLFVLEGHNMDPNPIFLCSFPSWGNVGQLAGDLILATLSSLNSLVRVGSIESEDVMPMSGIEQWHANSEEFLCSPIEVYNVSNTNIYIIQQRAPTVSHRTKSFAKSYINLLKSYNFEHLILLCGASLEGLPDEYMQSHRIFTIVPHTKDINNILGSHFPSLQKALLSTIHIPYNNIDTQNKKSTTFLQASLEDEEYFQSAMDENSPIGMDIIWNILEQSSQEDNILVIGRVCDEGDNAMDGVEIAKLFADDLHLFTDGKNSLVQPVSWKTLFGPPLSQENSYFY